MTEIKREITHIVLHCTATPASMDIGVNEIRDWHVTENGWSDIGYHYVIRRDGTIEDGRPVERQGAHVAGFNKNSIGVALVGGVASDGKTSEDNFTPEQIDAACTLCIQLMNIYGVEYKNVLGHKEVIDTITHGSPKDCPVFSMEDFRVRLFLGLANEHEAKNPNPIFSTEEVSYTCAEVNITNDLKVYVYGKTLEETKEKAIQLIKCIKN